MSRSQCYRHQTMMASTWSKSHSLTRSDQTPNQTWPSHRPALKVVGTHRVYVTLAIPACPPGVPFLWMLWQFDYQPHSLVLVHNITYHVEPDKNKGFPQPSRSAGDDIVHRTVGTWGVVNESEKDETFGPETFERRRPIIWPNTKGTLRVRFPAF